MARYLYDVNRTTRLLDVHKQFQGGLKTVDTDDALGAVFLREAQNVSLSEFGFIEKRYGTYFSEKYHLPSTPDGADNVLQGYWEFKNYKIHAHNNKFYVNGTPVSTITKEKPTKFRYPDNIDSLYPFVKVGNDYRDMNAVNIKDVLYIFTGYYPVYVKEVQGQLRFYWFSVDIPNYDEIVVTGHNLMEDSFEPLYFENQTELLIDVENINPTSTVNYMTFKDAEKVTYPRLPYVYDPDTGSPEDRDGKVHFVTAYKYNEVLDASSQTGTPFTGEEGEDLYVLNLSNIQYRTSGPGASTLDFIEGSKDNVEFTQFSNISGDLSEDLVLANEPIVTKTPLTEAELGNDENTDAFRIYDEDGSTRFFMRQMDIEKSFSITKADVDFDTQYAIKFDWIKEADDPATADNDAVYELIDFETLKQDVRDAYQTLYDDTTSEYILNNVNITDSIVKDYYGEILEDLNTRFYRIEITPHDINNLPFSNTTIVDHFDITSANARYVFKFPDNILQTNEVVGYFVKIVLPAYYIRAQVPNPLDLVFDVPDFDFFRYYTNSQDNDVVVGSLETILTVKQGATNSIGQDLVDLSVTNLISGLYDFRFGFDVVKYKVENGYVVKKDSERIFTDTFFNIQITQEKLKDFPRLDETSIGIEYPSIKQIWTCNKVIEHFGKLMVWGSTTMPTAVFYSFPDRPTYFPSKFYLDFQNDEGSELQNVTPYMNILVAQTEDRTWGIRGNSGIVDSPSPYVPFTINPTVGTIAYKSVRPVRNHLFFLSKQGIIALKSLYAADEQYNIEFMDRNIRNIVPQDKKAVGIQYDNQYWLNFPNFGITLRWYIDKKAWVKDIFAWGSAFKGVFKWQNINGKLEFITYPNALQDDVNSYVYKIGIDESLPADMGDNVLTKFETSFLNQNYPFHQKNYKEFKYDFTMQNEYNYSSNPLYDKTFSQSGTTSSIPLQASHFNLPFLKNHTYILSFDGVVELESLTIGAYGPLEFTKQLDGSYYLEGNTDYLFVIPNSYEEGIYDVELTLETEITNFANRVAITDVTYDDSVIFLSKVISEDRRVLNQQLPIGYNESQEALEINFQDFQDFTLGTTTFGDRNTFVKTIKLSGKGYNTKAYFEDFSRTKWTIESMGITYKMKRARSD